MEYLIQVPLNTADDQLCLLCGKILLYYAETQKVTASIVLCLLHLIWSSQLGFLSFVSHPGKLMLTILKFLWNTQFSQFANLKTREISAYKSSEWYDYHVSVLFTLFRFFATISIVCVLFLFLKTCNTFIAQPSFKDSLLQLAYNPDPVLQSVVAKIILSVLENCENRFVIVFLMASHIIRVDFHLNFST